MSDEIWPRLREVIREFFDDPDIEIAESSVASDVEGWDSMANIELMIEIERAFGVRFRTGELAELESVGALERLIGRHLEGR